MDDLFSQPKLAPTRKVTLHFDGGTPCNIPALGFGIGYGSYRYTGLEGQVGNGEPIRVSHGIPCSNNAAEILTLCVALEKLAEMGSPETTHVHVQGDSKIALKWLNVVRGQHPKGRTKTVATGTVLFIESIGRLRKAAEPFNKIESEWLQRDHAVAAFGH
jgi:ribonuclease HI